MPIGVHPLAMFFIAIIMSNVHRATPIYIVFIIELQSALASFFHSRKDLLDSRKDLIRIWSILMLQILQYNGDI